MGRLRGVFTRFTLASLIATGISQVVLVGLFLFSEMNANTASTVAFLVGAVPHFLLVRRWAWGRRGRGGGAADLLAYVVVTAIGGLVSVGLTTLVDWLVEPLVTDRAWRTVLLNVAYLAGGAPVFVLKYAVFDRVFTRRAPNDDSQASRDALDSHEGHLSPESNMSRETADHQPHPAV